MLNTPHQFSSKQKVWIIIGIIFLVVLVLILVSTYGYLLKTQANLPQPQYSSSGTLKTDALQPGSYTLTFAGKNAAGATATSSTSFSILGSTPLPY